MTQPETITWLTVELVTLMLVVIGVSQFVFSLHINRKVNKAGRTKIISDAISTFSGDEEMARAFYALEYNQFTYNKSFHGSHEERKMDKLLRHYANLALLWKRKTLSTEDLQPIAYYVIRITSNSQVGNYFAFLDSWTARIGIAHPYSALRELGEELAKKQRRRGALA